MKLADFLNSIGELTAAESILILDAAIVVLDQLYVHLPMKRAMYGANPVQRLRVLKRRLEDLPQAGSLGAERERWFHEEVTAVFRELRDLHTAYWRPEPYLGKVAVLPFLIEQYVEEKENGRAVRRHVVTRISGHVPDPAFVPGVEVTHWNGIRIDRAIELTAERSGGGNEEARRARGIDSLTSRPLWLLSVPDEEWVTITYLSDDQPREVRFEWEVENYVPPQQQLHLAASLAPPTFERSIDGRTEVTRRVKKHLYAPGAVDLERRAAEHETSSHSAGTLDLLTESLLPDHIAFREVATQSGTFGYIRLWSFDVPSVPAFINELARIMELLPQDGLILDVRGNAGGSMPAAERALQLFSPHAINPQALELVNTPLNLQLVRRVPFLERWRPSVAASVETGAVYSQGFTFDPAEEYNRIGQRYHGPVVLIVNGLSFSATDCFSAGFQDHRLGCVLGTEGNTGAGGATTVSYELLQRLFSEQSSPFLALPRKASFRIAYHRTIRVGDSVGVPLEGTGVVPDEIHHLTRRDILDGNTDLIEHAGRILAPLPIRRLSAEVTARTGGKLQVSCIVQGIDRLDVYLDSRPEASMRVTDGASSFEASPADEDPSRVLSLQGFYNNELVASRLIHL